MTSAGGEHSLRPWPVPLTLLLALLLQACSTPQTRDLLEPEQDNTHAVLLDVPFFAQTAYQCGPAALASLLTQRGVSTNPQALLDQVFVPALKGSLQPEIAATIRRHALLAYLPPAGSGHELATLVQIVRSGSPVLVLQQLGWGPWPQWHYAVAIGFDPDNRKIILHSGQDAAHPVALGVFERTWRRADFWAVAALPPAELPDFARRGPWIQGAIELEQAGRNNAAHEAYTAALERWPQDEQARLGRGNTAFALGRYGEAAQQYHRLTTAPGDAAAMGWNNLAHALWGLGCRDAAAAAARRGLALTPAEPTVRETVATMEAGRGAAAAAREPAPACDEWRSLGASS